MTQYLTDRTTIETDWACAQKRAWYKDYAGTGIVPKEEAVYYAMGRALHADLAAVAVGEPVGHLMRARLLECDHLVEPNMIDWETAWWHASMLAAFALYIWPKWSEVFEPIMVEKELILERPPLRIACTADLVMRGKAGGPVAGRVIVIDYKTVRWLTAGWHKHWAYAVQMLINPKAVEEHLGVQVHATYVMGIQKPIIRDGKGRHVYTYGYTNVKEWRHEWTSKWDVRPLWERLGGGDALPVYSDEMVASILAWVKEVGEVPAMELFPLSTPILANDRMLDKLIEERMAREEGIRRDPGPHQYTSAFSVCQPTMGDACPYLAACHNAHVQSDPIGSGLYVPRNPHHDVEWLERAADGS